MIDKKNKPVPDAPKPKLKTFKTHVKDARPKIVKAESAAEAVKKTPGAFKAFQVPSDYKLPEPPKAK